MRTGVDGIVKIRGRERRSTVDAQEERNRGGVGQRRSGIGLAGSNPVSIVILANSDAVELRDQGEVGKGGMVTSVSDRVEAEERFDAESAKRREMRRCEEGRCRKVRLRVFARNLDIV